MKWALSLICFFPELAQPSLKPVSDDDDDEAEDAAAVPGEGGVGRKAKMPRGPRMLAKGHAEASASGVRTGVIASISEVISKIGGGGDVDELTRVAERQVAQVGASSALAAAQSMVRKGVGTRSASGGGGTFYR